MGKRKVQSVLSNKKDKRRKEKVEQSTRSLNKIATRMYATNLNSEFCMQMAIKVLIKNMDKGSNTVLSPLSIQLMLSLTAAGSKGRTLEQLLTHLGSKSIEQLNDLSSQIVNCTLKSNHHGNGPLLSFGTGVWVDKRFLLKPSFEMVAKGTYKAKAKEVDFATKADEVTDKMNKWVKKKTRGLITGMFSLGSINSRTALILANALYFKGEWDQAFSKELTTKRNFHLMDKQTVEVPFMTRKEREKYLYNSFDDYKVLAIPYKKDQDSRRFSMYFFLPNEINGLPNILQKINVDPNFMSQIFELRTVELDCLWIPKFKFSFELEASETIKKMGINLPFLDVGDFTEMVDSSRGEELYLSKVFHKSFIEVNEDGTEAAACTAMFIDTSSRISRLSFVADHPFMFMIKEEVSGVVLFTGAVMNPL